MGAAVQSISLPSFVYVGRFSISASASIKNCISEDELSLPAILVIVIAIRIPS